MVSDLRKLSFKLSIVGALILLAPGCLPDLDNRKAESAFSQVGSVPKAIVAKNCEDLAINWMGKTYYLGDKIGEGLSGVVFSLRDGSVESSEYVVKVITKPGQQVVFDEMMDEVRMFNEFGQLFVPSWFNNMFEYLTSQGNTVYHGFLLKQRVNGVTGYRILIGDDIGVPVTKLLDQFLAFKRDLALRMQYMAESHEVYLWDLHLKNLMYDNRLQKWMLVDANRSQGFESYVKQLERIVARNKLRTQAHFYSSFVDFIKSNQLNQDDAFFNRYLDFYFGSLEGELRIRAKRPYAEDAAMEEITL